MPEHPLRAWLYGQQISQAEFAEMVGLRNRSMLSLMFTGQRRPSKELARRISQATKKQISIEQLLSFEVPAGLRRRSPKDEPEVAEIVEERPEKLHS